MSYRDLEIWKLARQVAIAVNRTTLQNSNVFMDGVEHSHRTNRSDIPDHESRIAHLAS